jgi:tRNA pseudouridine55 synthase
MTSHDVVDVVRRSWKRCPPLGLSVRDEPKVGHLGTLDPDASGVLPLAIGKATKLISLLPPAEKVYVAEITLGLTSDSGDLAGQLTLSPTPFCGSVERLDQILASFVGTIMQSPPQVSALKRDGKRGYELARKGEQFEFPPRPTTYHHLNRLGPVQQIMPNESCAFFLHRQSDLTTAAALYRFRLHVACGSGTYIRALARDIGIQLGCGALLSGLTRSLSGCFRLEDASTLSELKNWPFIPIHRVPLAPAPNGS